MFNILLQDLDLAFKFRLEAGKRDLLVRQMAADCKLLEELKVMDYSLLLGVHFRQTDGAPSSSNAGGETEVQGDDGAEGHATRSSDTSNDGNQVSVTILKNGNDRHARMKALQQMATKEYRERSLSDVLSTKPAYSDGMRPIAGSDGGSDAIAHAIGAAHVRLGENMVATAIPGRVLKVWQPSTCLAPKLYNAIFN